MRPVLGRLAFRADAGTVVVQVAGLSTAPAQGAAMAGSLVLSRARVMVPGVSGLPHR